MKKITSLLTALLTVLSLALPAFAAESRVEYYGHKLFDFEPGSTYTTTDLFDNFKGVMPGDTLREKVTVKNTARCCDYIKVYLRAIPHGRYNALSPNVARETTLAKADAFLSQLDLTVWEGDNLIFSGKANELDGLKDKVCLAKLKRSERVVLDVELNVPIGMDNEFALALGEVDWEFTIEEYDYDSDNPKTGDHMRQYLLPCILVMVVSAAALVILLLVKRKRDQKD